jgi:hypothetical protein
VYYYNSVSLLNLRKCLHNYISIHQPARAAVARSSSGAKELVNRPSPLQPRTCVRPFGQSVAHIPYRLTTCIVRPVYTNLGTAINISAAAAINDQKRVARVSRNVCVCVEFAVSGRDDGRISNKRTAG